MEEDVGSNSHIHIATKPINLSSKPIHHHTASHHHEAKPGAQHHRPKPTHHQHHVEEDITNNHVHVCRALILSYIISTVNHLCHLTISRACRSYLKFIT